MSKKELFNATCLLTTDGWRNARTFLRLMDELMPVVHMELGEHKAAMNATHASFKELYWDILLEVIAAGRDDPNLDAHGIADAAWRQHDAEVNIKTLGVLELPEGTECEFGLTDDGTAMQFRGWVDEGEA